jgi:hypothetical protein
VELLTVVVGAEKHIAASQDLTGVCLPGHRLLCLPAFIAHPSFPSKEMSTASESFPSNSRMSHRGPSAGGEGMGCSGFLQ